MSKANGRKAAHEDRRDRQDRQDRQGGVRAAAARIAVNRGPISDLVLGADGEQLVVTNYGRDSVSIVDTGTRRVTCTVAGLDEPFGIAMGSRGGSRAYVSTVARAYDAITVIDVSAATVVETHPLALRVSDLAASPDGARVYVTRNGADGAGDLAVLDAATGRVGVVELPAAAGATVECVRVSPDGSRLYVAVNGPAGGQLFVLCAAGVPRVVGTVRVAFPVRDVALSPDGALAYVAGCGPDFSAVDVVDTRSHAITRTRKVGDIDGMLTGLSVSGDGDRAYVVTDAGVTVLCTLTHDIVGAVAVTDRPSRVLESPDGRWLYVADHAGVVTATPVASVTGVHIAGEAGRDGEAVGLVRPDLSPREPALV